MFRWVTFALVPLAACCQCLAADSLDLSKVIVVTPAQMNKQEFKATQMLVDAKGLSRLYRPPYSPSWLAALCAAGILPILVVIANSAGLQRWLGLFGMAIEAWVRRHGLR